MSGFCIVPVAIVRERYHLTSEKLVISFDTYLDALEFLRYICKFDQYTRTAGNPGFEGEKRYKCKKGLSYQRCTFG